MNPHLVECSNWPNSLHIPANGAAKRRAKSAKLFCTSDFSCGLGGHDRVFVDPHLNRDRSVGIVMVIPLCFSRAGPVNNLICYVGRDYSCTSADTFRHSIFNYSDAVHIPEPEDMLNQKGDLQRVFLQPVVRKYSKIIPVDVAILVEIDSQSCIEIPLPRNP